jgi:SpoVK/Ycf46/Vps4 family AAA+-type ATPase
MTSGFSGADLQSLVSNAQLEAIHDVLDDSRAENEFSAVSTELSSAELRLWKDKEQGMNASQKSDLLKQVGPTVRIGVEYSS